MRNDSAVGIHKVIHGFIVRRGGFAFVSVPSLVLCSTFWLICVFPMLSKALHPCNNTLSLLEVDCCSGITQKYRELYQNSHLTPSLY